MLIEFSVENFRCFRDKATLSMVCASKDSSLPENTIPADGVASLRLTRSAAIYGPNASGKSKFLDAMRFMRDFVVGSHFARISRAEVDVTPFRLDARYERQPCTFEAVFNAEGSRYVYGFSVDQERVRAEWLSSYPRGQQRVLLEGTWSDKDGFVDYYFGPSWKGQKKKFQELVRPNVLLISVAAQLNHPIARTVYSWFADTFRYVSWFPTYGQERDFTCRAGKELKHLRPKLLKYFRKADPGIQDFSIRQAPLTEAKEWTRVPESFRKSFVDEVLGGHPEKALTWEVRTNHCGADTKGDTTQVVFDLADESDGTQKLFALAGPWQYVLEHGCVVFVDELDARLHPLLVNWLIGLFHNPETNPNNAQLIFATHDVSLLDHRPYDRPLFRRDQIWFTEKDASGASRLYSLWNFRKKPRREENVRLGYLAGRYGAIPWLEDEIE